MDHLKDNFTDKGPVSQVPASWFNRVAKFINNLVPSDTVHFEKHDDGNATVLEAVGAGADLSRVGDGKVVVGEIYQDGAETKKRLVTDSAFATLLNGIFGVSGAGSVLSGVYVKPGKVKFENAQKGSAVIVAGDGSLAVSAGSFLTKTVADGYYADKATEAAAQDALEAAGEAKEAAEIASEESSEALESVGSLAEIVEELVSVCLTEDDIGTTVAKLSHTHGNITADGKINGCTSNDCLVVTGANGLITHSDSNPKASDVAALVTQWINNGRKIGGGSITHDKITDWASATANFATKQSVEAVEDAVVDITVIVEGILGDYLSTADIGVTVARQSHTHTTSQISNWGAATANFATKSELSGYATIGELEAVEGSVEDLVDIVYDIYDDYIGRDEIPTAFIQAIASRKSGSFRFLCDVQWTGTYLQKKMRTVTVSDGIITNLGTEGAWSTWETPTVITWS